MSKIKKATFESCYSNLIFLSKNHFQDDKVSIFPQKLAQNFENALFLSARHYFNLQGINVSFEYRKSSIRSRPCIISNPKFPRLVLEVFQKL